MKPIVAANWKMNLTLLESHALLEEILNQSKSTDTKVIFFPSFISLPSICDKLRDAQYAVGGQNISDKESGAYTGEISASMLQSLNAHYVIIGHSERRQFYHENDSQINDKILHALNAKLKPIVCIGETLQERQDDETALVLKRQLTTAFENIDQNEHHNIIVAYEPVWAIGTGQTAEENQILEAHKLIKKTLKSIFDNNIPTLYGGSVTADNALSLINIDHVDGFLIGGASLNSESFCQIIKNIT